MAGQAAAQDLSGLARIIPDQSGAKDLWRRSEVTLALSQAVPYRAYTLDGPPRLVLDFQEVDWGGLRPLAFEGSDMIESLRAGPLRPGWSRMVVLLSGPYRMDSLEMATDTATNRATLSVVMKPTEMSRFAALAGAPPGVLSTTGPQPKTQLGQERQDGSRPLRVVIDPGHGGLDPGAVRDGVKEADLMLIIARELRDALRRSLGAEVTLTRDADVFVPLEARVTIARDIGADLFVSLHADALAEGYAEGASAYALSDEASDAAAAALAASHDRADLLAGVDLTGQDDVVATVLMDLARMETAPRSQRLAYSVMDGLADAGARVHSRPHRSANFAVLRSPDIPSVLVEVGFLSSDKDLIELQSPEKRGRIVEGLKIGIANWAVIDAAESELIRQ